MPFHDDLFDDANEEDSYGHSRFWQEWYFPPGERLGRGQVHWVPSGPLGDSRLASRKELFALKKAGKEDNQQYLQLLSAYAIAHDPQPSIVDMGPLALPLGVDSPNILAVGRSGSGKTQSVTLPAAVHALRCGWSMVYINVKGKKQTRFLRRLAKVFGRGPEVQLISPLKLDRTTATTCLEGCRSLSKANEVAACMVAAAARNSRYGEGAWTYNQAQEWLQHAIAALCTDMPPSRRTLNELRQVVLAGDFQAFAKAHPNFPLLARFAGHADGGNKNTDTVISTISECTVFIDEIKGFLSKNELSFRGFAKSGGCIIVEIDQADIQRLRPIVTLLLGKVIASLQRAANASPTGCVPHKTVVIIDELIASGPVPGLADALHTCRELGFSFVAGAQGLSQLGNIYGHEAPAVLDGFQTQIAFGGGLDWATAEHFSRRTGVGTIALPGVSEPSDSEGDLTFSRQWQLAARPMLLPSEIASPAPNRFLGLPVTILTGDGKTPPFQAYLTPCHKHGALEKMQEEAALPTADEDRRATPLRRVRSTAVSRSAAVDHSAGGFTNTTGWSNAQINKKIAEGCRLLSWDEASDEAKKWWLSLHELNRERSSVMLRLVEELQRRSSTIEEFFDVFVKSGTDDIAANVIYLDFLRQKEGKRPAAKKTTPRAGRNNASASKTDGSREVEEFLSSLEGDKPRELTFFRCPACRMLVAANQAKCLYCGHKL